ncbi:MAG: glycoside hydrolase family 25 [Clostridia bacterium]|nr:glycoside hydrolase family 25 [Clostridia bacterium]
MKRTVKIAVLASISVVALSLFTVALLLWNGVFYINNPSREDFPVRGVDVSAYQGEIDWQTLASQDIEFAFIKATEGSSFTDKCFAYNHREALKTDLRVGAYHFFSFESGGDTQAENFIKAVPKTENMLPPVVDVEFYGNFSAKNVDTVAIVSELKTMTDALYEHYGMHPIIYTAEEEYSLFIEGRFESNPIWIRGVYSEPHISDGRNWNFWQFTNRAKLDGYNGEERFIDMNVFNGSLEEFESFGK